MVSTRGMDARVEFLERKFEGLLAMRENGRRVAKKIDKSDWKFVGN